METEIMEVIITNFDVLCDMMVLELAGEISRLLAGMLEFAMFLGGLIAGCVAAYMVLKEA